MKSTGSISRGRAIVLNRSITLTAVSAALLSYFWYPASLLQMAADVLVRAYLHFIAGVMAHESVHGHLGNSKSTNRWWGRLALLPTTVPYVTFHTTHLHHHRSTNIPGADPDEFLNTAHRWQIPLRAFALPYHWVVWMFKTDRLTRPVRIEYGLHYLVVAATYGTIAYLAGIERVVLGLLASATLHSMLLWYCFAIKTHEGYSTGKAERRSHNYYGGLMFWFSFGLSMHRLHHMKPGLAWLQMLRLVPQGTWRQQLTLRRDTTNVDI